MSGRAYLARAQGVPRGRERPPYAVSVWEILAGAVFLLLVGWQVFVPPIVGLSDNNDFAKVLGPARICKASPDNLNSYFVSGYAAGPKCEYPSGFTSSEILLTRVARYLARPFTGRYWFDLRASAAVHLAILMAAMGVLLAITRRLRAPARYGLPVLAMLMFSDVAYVAYLNSALMDNASWVSLLLLTATGALACLAPETWWAVPLYAGAGLLLVGSKAQHAVLGIPFAGLAAYLAWRCRDAVQRMLWFGCAMALCIATAVMPVVTPAGYANISLYNVIFSRLAPADRGVLGELGLEGQYLDRVGTNAFAADSPLQNPDWSREFASRVSFGDLAMLYLRNPEIAWREIDLELHDSVHAMRPDYMANYRREDGFPPHSVATEFGWWSTARMDVMSEYPYVLIALYGLPVIAAAAFRISRRRWPALTPLGLALIAAGVAEFAICTLTDGVDTHRHLFLFHVITDCLILLCSGWLLTARSRRPPELP